MQTQLEQQPPTPQEQASPEDEWQEIAPGLHQRDYIPLDRPVSRLTVLRIDPAQYRFRVHYEPGQPNSFQEWLFALPEAQAFINANFFDANHEIVGLLVADGISYGQPYLTFGGSFVIYDEILTVAQNPLYQDHTTALNQVVQGFPMLVAEGEAVFTSSDDARLTRRSVIGQDTQGRIILMATPLLGLTLSELSHFLAESDMNLVNAFNLDGGGSTMMYIQPSNFQLQSLDSVPAVLAIYPQ